MAKKPAAKKRVEAIRHTEDKRKNIPTAEHQSVLQKEQEAPRPVKYPRNTDLDPQLVWRGKDSQDWNDLVVPAPPLYIQEKIHPKVLIDDLLRQSNEARVQESGSQIDLFSDFNGMPAGVERTEFYQHDQNWSNRLILGDSLQVMASLGEREGLRGKVQCIYIDPPYGIKFNSNFQWSTTSRDVKDGKAEHITREPEQVKAFRDTWRDGIHSYLTYLRDRLAVARELLTESGSIFVQIGDENVHRVRALMDEVFGDDNCISVITLKKTAGQDQRLLNNVSDYILWFAKAKASVKFRTLHVVRSETWQELGQYGRIQLEDDQRRGMTRDDFDGRGELQAQGRPFRLVIATSSGHGGNKPFPVTFSGRTYLPTANRHWSTHSQGFQRLVAADRVAESGATLAYVRFFDDFVAQAVNNIWSEVGTASDKTYVVETAPAVVQRCVLMTTDPGDLVLDPTCGSGTTAYVAEQWGRRWITIDTSRVALALARARIMGGRYPYYLLADSPDGQRKEAEVSGRAYVEKPTYGSVRQGFVYERVPHVTLKSIANDAEIDVICEKWQAKVQDALARLNGALRGHRDPFRITTGGREGKEVRFNAAEGAVFTLPSQEVVPAFGLLEWEVPREAPADWPAGAREPLAAFWEARVARQREIDSSIAAKAEFEPLYDRPYEDRTKVRVAGPFTVESISPHRMLGVDENDQLIDPFKVGEGGAAYGPGQGFEQMILENLKLAGVQQPHKEDRITFTSLTTWPGELVCAEGRYRDAETERRAGIFIGPEFGTVSRPDLVAAAREAGDAGFDVLIACAFNYEAHATEFSKLGRVPVLKARMNADLHMAGDLKATSKGNLFVVFGEPDIAILNEDGDRLRVKVKGVDVFDPATGEVRSDGAEGIACWFVDTDYNEESFFVRHAYFLGQNDPYTALKTTLKAEIDADAWTTLHSDTSRSFGRPKSGRIAVKVINHLGDEVMKVFRV
jgi:adenine-specific DNA-methyltransferase